MMLRVSAHQQLESSHCISCYAAEKSALHSLRLGGGLNLVALGILGICLGSSSGTRLLYGAQKRGEADLLPTWDLALP